MEANHERILSGSGGRIRLLHRGHHGRKLEKPQVLISGRKRGLTPQMKKELQRRSAVEPVTGHMKNGGKLGRNYLLGALGGAINALLCGAGRNIRLILKKLREKLFLFFAGLLLAAWHRSDCRKSAAALPAPVF